MTSRTPRPATPGGAQRAAGLEFLDGTSNPNDPQKLATALQRGAILYVGPNDSPLSLESLQSTLKQAFLFDDDYRHRQLIGPTALRAHWFRFTGRQGGLNHLYPATFLHELIVKCFGLDYAAIPMDAVLAGLIERGFQVERIKAKGWSSPFNNGDVTLNHMEK
jgi:hypothetical protein